MAGTLRASPVRPDDRASRDRHVPPSRRPPGDSRRDAVSVDAAATLHELIVSEGPGLADDPRRLRALLADDLAGDATSAGLIATAAEAGVPAELRALAIPLASGWDAVGIERLVASGMSQHDAAWVVRVWAFALGLDPMPPGARPDDLSEDFKRAAVADLPQEDHPDTLVPGVPGTRATASTWLAEHRTLAIGGAAAVVVLIIVIALIAGSGGGSKQAGGSTSSHTDTGQSGPGGGSTSAGGGTTGPGTTAAGGTSTAPPPPPLTAGFGDGFNVGSPSLGTSGAYVCTATAPVDTESEAAYCDTPDGNSSILLQWFESADAARAVFDDLDAPEQIRTQPGPAACLPSSYKLPSDDGRAVVWEDVPYLVWFNTDDPAWHDRWIYTTDVACGIQ
jgi:hypothetical protein